jgi:hypothetical protein
LLGSGASVASSEVEREQVSPVLHHLLAAGVSSAVSQDVSYNFDSTVNFSKFKTYKWVTLKSRAPIDKLTDEQVKASLDAALGRKGLTKVDTESADLFIGYQTTEQIREQFGGSDYPVVGPGWNGSSDSIRTVYKGELAVDMYDPANQHLVWRGVASKTFNRLARTPDERQKNLEKAVSKLMKNYPPTK